MASIIAEVRTAMLFRTRRMPIFEVTFGQGRSTLKCIWFHGTYLKDRFKPGMLVALYGKVDQSSRGSRGGLQIIQPQFEVLAEPVVTTRPDRAQDEFDQERIEREAEQKVEQSLEIGRIVPIYESAANQQLTSRWFRGIIYRALQNLEQKIPDGLPYATVERQGLIDRRKAFETVHFPPVGESFALLQDKATPAHTRLVFEELFFLEVGLELKRKKLRARPGIAFKLDDKVRAAIKKFLPFHPTAAQKRVLKEIADDMQQPSPMRRLLQGDVGSGKTIVAFQAAIIAIENGYQVALMAPTEILAQQHYFSARQILERAGYRIVLLTGSLEQDRKRDVRRHIAQGNAHLVIGTHALIEEKVEFAKLGLVIVDEQHRFGVMQRLKLMKKGTEVTVSVAARPASKSTETKRGDTTVAPEPDVLVMTATPIPRTLALTIYGDLDLSVLDEMPPGRTPIVTRCVSDERCEEVWEFVRKQVGAGHQAYVVYPVIEENEENELKAAIKMHKEMRQRIFPELHVGLLHGRLHPDEKEHVMKEFQKGDISVLVSSTVIEVGVDVPNATIMVVEHAERFGLSQLHQLRGRIGRGAAKSYCILR